MSARAIVLLSGGLDSATTLAVAQDRGYRCHTLAIRYGQRHAAELAASAAVSKAAGAEEHREFDLPIGQWGGSSLTDEALSVPTQASSGIPNTYVPARNTVFIAVAASWAEVVDADAIFLGVNAVDYSGYPDCRPEFIDAMQRALNLGTRDGVEGRGVAIEAPLIHMTKAEIVQLGTDLGVDYARTVSCYQPDESGAACGRCDACRLRAQGFADAGLPDPTRYASSAA